MGKMSHDMLIKGLYDWCVKKDFHVIQRFKTRGIENAWGVYGGVIQVYLSSTVLNQDYV